ncbi:MAG: hypothetical protein HQK50_02900 [Oligoflexia bacterium]|nr:hypothetical protein [Oligoflexia bacterium]MBF0364490.1 hypothetical protein [Oligoflexia bacterium]
MENIQPACLHCGWCCRRAPCPLAIYLGEGPAKLCTYLASLSGRCTLLEREQNPLKQAALFELLLIGKGCTHRFGPHPIAILKQLMAQGLVITNANRPEILKQTRQTLESMAQSEPFLDHIQCCNEFADFLNHC